jgi:hypothetical protein
MSPVNSRAKLGIGGAMIALAATVGLGFTSPAQQEQLPTVKVWHDPT